MRPLHLRVCVGGLTCVCNLDELTVFVLGTQPAFPSGRPCRRGPLPVVRQLGGPEVPPRERPAGPLGPPVPGTLPSGHHRHPQSQTQRPRRGPRGERAPRVRYGLSSSRCLPACFHGLHQRWVCCQPVLYLASYYRYPETV